VDIVRQLAVQFKQPALGRRARSIQTLDRMSCLESKARDPLLGLRPPRSGAFLRPLFGPWNTCPNCNRCNDLGPSSTLSGRHETLLDNPYRGSCYHHPVLHLYGITDFDTKG
jgi:hypothetical protein